MDLLRYGVDDLLLIHGVPVVAEPHDHIHTRPGGSFAIWYEDA